MGNSEQHISRRIIKSLSAKENDKVQPSCRDRGRCIDCWERYGQWRDKYSVKVGH